MIPDSKDIPPGLISEGSIWRSFFESFLKKRDRDSNGGSRFEGVKKLFESSSDQESDWEALKTLQHYGFVDFKPPKNVIGNPWDGLKIKVCLDAEPCLRELLNYGESPLLRRSLWIVAVQGHESKFTGSTASLAIRQFKVVGKSDSEVVQAFASIKEQLQQPMTLRQLSARCFWGDSKLLDDRDDLVAELFPDLAHNIKPRRLSIRVHLQKQGQGVLFIENEDTFHQFCVEELGLHLVYCSGYKMAAKRARTIGDVAISFTENSCLEERALFLSWLYEDRQLPSFFWGDLDYEGMNILQHLQRVFSSVQAWKPGYKAMIRLQNTGVCHRPEAATKLKNKQSKPLSTGCLWADSVVLKALEKKQFVDQEAVLAEELIYERLLSMAG